MLTGIKNRLQKTHILHSPKLKAGKWYDTDVRMEYCILHALVDFVENELEFDIEGRYHEPEIAEEIRSLYEWWKLDCQEEIPAEGGVTDKLIRIIEIREYFWT